MAEIFISYSKHDRPLALDLAEELRAKGFSVWIDQGGIEGAQNWSARIVDGITECSAMVLLISPQAVASRNVAREVHLAYEKSKHILPVVIERVKLPANFEYSLAGIQHVYYNDRPAIFHALELLRSGLPAVEELPSLHEPADDAIRVAVLPFDDLSPQRDNQWFADGIMDELITTLSQLDRVKVPSRSDVLHYRERRAKSRDIARDLGVRYLIEGAVRKAGERIRINATLIDTRQNEQLWGNQFNGTFEDVFAFQESVSKHIADALQLKLTPDQQHRLEDGGTQNAEAYELYLKGRHEQYYVTKESYLRALEYYEQAAALDPQFANAHISIASLSCAYYREYSRSPKWLVRAESNLAIAEATTGQNAMSLRIRGMIAWMKGDNSNAISLLTRATALDPKNHSSYNILGNVQISAGNYSAAADAFQKVADLVEDTQAYFNLLMPLTVLGDEPRLRRTALKALPVFDRYLLREPGDQSAAVSRAFVLYYAGKKDEADQAAENLLGRDDLSGQAIYNLGVLFNNLEKPQTFVALVRKAIDHGFRSIGQVRQNEMDIEDSECLLEFKQILTELEEIIEREQALS